MPRHGEVQYHDLHQREIRLVDVLSGRPSDPIQCVLRSTSLDDHPRYEAVSYTWGPKTYLDRTLWVNARPCRVQPKVFSVIHTVRHERLVRSLWIDSLCINQQDEKEKTDQVRIMDRIYSGAEHVLLCLGPAEADSDVVFDYMETLGQSTVDMATASIPSIYTMNKAIKNLCERDYWSRAWIRQELILAKEIEIYCGKRMAKWEVFARMCGVHFLETVYNTPVYGLLQHRSRYQRDESQTLLELLLEYGQAKCHDPRDLVYSLLSLASDCAEGKGIQANYSLGVACLFQNLVSHCQPPDPAKFLGLLCKITYPQSPRIERFPGIDILTAVMGSVYDQSQAKFFHAESRSPNQRMYDPNLEYVALKIRLVWQVIAVDCPREPTNFRSVYESHMEVRKSPSAEIVRAQELLDILDRYSVLFSGLENTLAWIYDLMLKASALILSPREAAVAKNKKSVERWEELRSSRTKAHWKLLERVGPKFQAQNDFLEFWRDLDKTLRIPEM